MSISKLRNEYKKEKDLMKKMIKDAGDDMIRAPRKETTAKITSVIKFKLEVDPKKLEETIKKACVPVQKKNIIVLETIPVFSAAAKPVAAPVAPVAICQSRNLNGTPCKCKAKIGKFCAKHAP